MQDFGPLFREPVEPSSGEGAPTDTTLGVLALNQSITDALAEKFPGEVWVRGEIQGLARTRARRHWYFELVEKDPRSDQVLAKVSVALLQWNRSAVDRALASAPGFELEDDLEVRILCEVGYYAPFGKLQLVMKGIDPEFTLGQMAVNRERILRQLSAEGLLDRNSQCPLPVVPQRIGLVTSLGSAAYNDFVHEIQSSGLGLHILACDARVQGAQTESTVVAALRTLQRAGCDLLVLIRGGGSRSDLAGFDTESIARAISTAPVAVWTGIGHEIDHSVADVVAHRSFKTPTAVAGAIVEWVEGFVNRVEAGQARLETATAAKLQREEQSLSTLSRALTRAGRAASERAEARLQRRSREVVHGARLRLAQAHGQWQARASALAPARFARRLDRRQQNLFRSRQRLGQLADRALRDAQRQLTSVRTRVQANDPHRLLQRGYSLSFDAEGRLLREVGALGLGEELTTRLAAGEIRSRIESVSPTVDTRSPDVEESNP